MFKNISFSMPAHLKQFNKQDSFPFTEVQLLHFRKELKRFGGFHGFLFQKKALDKRMGMKYMCQYRNIEMYRHKYLVGIYEPLRPFYDTEMPFVFWSEMYEVLLASEFDQ